MNKPLDRAIAEEMITALLAINKIKNDPDRKPEPNDAALLEDLEIFLRQNFLDPASEFLGWKKSNSRNRKSASKCPTNFHNKKV